MILEQNGIRVEVLPSGRSFTFQVLDQTQEATNILKHAKLLQDNETGYTLRVNMFPSFNREKRRFFLRGDNVDKAAKRVRVDLDSIEEANRAIEALRRLISQVVNKDIVSPQPLVPGRPKVPGSTAHLRFNFINRSMAQFLELTGKDAYPLECIKWEPTKPIVTRNTHYNEHIAQGIDVLNKSLENPTVIDGVINQHKVTPQQAKAAVELLKACFDKAQKGNYLVAWWRIATALRGPDFIPCPTCGKEC